MLGLGYADLVMQMSACVPEYYCSHTGGFFDIYPIIHSKPIFVAQWRHMATYIWVNIGLGNGSLPYGNKPLPEPMLAKQKWGPVTFTRGQFHRKCSRYGILSSDACHWTSLKDKSTSVQVMAWCLQTTCHYMSQGLPRSMLAYDTKFMMSYDITRSNLRKSHVPISYSLADQSFCMQHYYNLALS